MTKFHYDMQIRTVSTSDDEFNGDSGPKAVSLSRLQNKNDVDDILLEDGDSDRRPLASSTRQQMGKDNSFEGKDDFPPAASCTSRKIGKKVLGNNKK